MNPFWAIITLSQINSWKIDKICDIFKFTKWTSLKDICLWCWIFTSWKEYKANHDNLHFNWCTLSEWTEYENIEENTDNFFLYLGKKWYMKKMYQINII